MNIESLKNEPRLLIEARLRPIAGTRFQPTGFPDLGAATYKSADGVEMLLVESAQSMANRLEAVCWDEGAARIRKELEGVPYVESTLPDGCKTNSLLEAHRLNSPYLVNTPEFAEIERAIGFEKNKPFDRIKLAAALLRFDPCSLLHGIFLEKIGGVVRLPRALTAFIEARNASRAASGGVKVDRVQPESTGKNTLYGKAEDGYGNVPYPRDEFCGEITAFFNLDIALLKGLALPAGAVEFLILLSLFKVRSFLETGLRLRTACDLEIVETKITRPKIHEDIPPLTEIEPLLRQATAGLRPNFGSSPFPVSYSASVAKAKKDAKKKQREQESKEDTGSDEA